MNQTQRKQRGQGIRNTLRSLFTRKAKAKVAPIQKKRKEQPVSEPTDKPMQNYETVLPYTDRIFPFWYSRINPAKANAFLQKIGSPLSFLPLNESQKKLTKEQQAVLLTLVDAIFTGEDGDIDATKEFADTLMNIPIGKFDDELRNMEATGKQVYDPYKKRVVIAQSFAGQMSRLPPLLRKTRRNLEYFSNWSSSTCGFTPEMASNSFTTFQSDFCIPTVDTTGKGMEQVVAAFSISTRTKVKNTLPPNYPYLVIKDQYLPIVTKTRSTSTLTKAKEFPNVRWIQDAFKDNAVLDIQEDLADVMRKEAFSLWNASLWLPLTKLSNLTTINFLKEKYILTDNTFFPTKYIYVNLDFFEAYKRNQFNRRLRVEYLAMKKMNLLMNLLKNKKIYGMDPLTSIYLRRYFPSEWKNLTNDPNLRMFKYLNTGEQLALAQLQHSLYCKILFGYLCGAEPDDEILNNSDETPFRKEAALEAMKVYSMNLNSSKVRKSLLELVRNSQDKLLYEHVLDFFTP